MTNANRIMVDPLYNLPYSEKDWSNACSKINEEYSKQTKGIIMGVTIAEIFLLCVLTVFSFLIAIPLSIVVFETDPAFAKHKVEKTSLPNHSAGTFGNS